MTTSLKSLHDVIQAVMPFENCEDDYHVLAEGVVRIMKAAAAPVGVAKPARGLFADARLRARPPWPSRAGSATSSHPDHQLLIGSTINAQIAVPSGLTPFQPQLS